MAAREGNEKAVYDAASAWLAYRGVPNLAYTREDLEDREGHRFWWAVVAVAYGFVASTTTKFDLPFDVVLPLVVFLALQTVVEVTRRRNQSKKDPTPQPQQLNWALVVAIVSLPAADLIDGGSLSAGEVAAALAASGLVVIAAIATLKGLGHLISWGVGHPLREARQNGLMLVSALPLLLLTIAFLFLQNELWQAMDNIRGRNYWWTVGAFAALAAFVAFALAARRIRELEKGFKCPHDVPDAIGDPPAWWLDKRWKPRKRARRNLETVKARLSDGPLQFESDCFTLEKHERRGITLVLAFGLITQMLMVVLVMGLSLLGFGHLMVDDDTLGRWQVAPTHVEGVEVFGLHPVSWFTLEHWRVTGLLAVFGGLSYGVGAAVVDEQQRLFIGALEGKVRARLGVRAVLRAVRPHVPPPER